MTESEKQLRKILAERVAILDGAMGTMIQSYKLDEQAFRGAQFVHHGHDLKGCNDVLCITKPDLVTDIHIQYLEAGADIIETNTFNSTSVSMTDYRLESVVYDLNFAGAQAAKKAVELVMAKDPTRPRFVAGAIARGQAPCISAVGFVFTRIVACVSTIDQRKVPIVLKIIGVEVSKRMRIETHVRIVRKK